MDILIGAFIKIHFQSKSLGPSTENIFVIGLDPEQMVQAVNERILTGYKLSRSSTNEILNLTDINSMDTLTAELGEVRTMPVMQCQIETLYAVCRNQLFIFGDHITKSTKAINKIKKQGFYGKLFNKLNVQLETNSSIEAVGT